MCYTEEILITSGNIHTRFYKGLREMAVPIIKNYRH